MSKYKAIFFDLDHTLWDFDLNSRITIEELFVTHKLEDRGILTPGDFIATYREINQTMWDRYHRNDISKEMLRAGRFAQALSEFGINDAILAESLAKNYLLMCPVKTNLFPGAIEILEFLAQKYSLHIITNGFREVQHLKIKSSGLTSYFTNIHISEEIGFKKPEPEIFNYAVKLSRVSHEQCLMIGDNLEADITGAENAGIDPVFFNPAKVATNRKVLHEIHHLEQLRNIL